MTTVGRGARNYGGRPVSERKAERRRRFVDAALEVFADKTFAQSSVADVCRAANLSRRQFYEEFSGREDVLLVLYDQVQDQAMQAIVAALSAQNASDPKVLAAAAMKAYVEAIGQDPRKTRISYVEIVGVSPSVEQHRQRGRQEWASFIEHTMTDALGTEYEPPGGFALASTAIIGALVALVQTWSTSDPRPPVENLVELMTVLLTALIGE